jgi:hypothetical protein
MTDFPAGGFAFVRGVFQYSAGVAALPAYRLERVRFAEPLPLSAGFATIAAFLRHQGLPLTAFCACELRSPAPFSEEGFLAFNTEYAAVLRDWGLLASGDNPVARSNVCPAIDPPDVPSFHAFCFARPAADARPSFVIAGSGESREGQGNYRDHTISLGDTSAAGLRRKAEFVLDEMQRRMGALNTTWRACTAVQVYTVHDIHPFMADELVRRGAARQGITWHFNRPPVIDLEYEMDCRSVPIETVL